MLSARLNGLVERASHHDRHQYMKVSFTGEVACQRRLSVGGGPTKPRASAASPPGSASCGLWRSRRRASVRAFIEWSLPERMQFREFEPGGSPPRNWYPFGYSIRLCALIPLPRTFRRLF
jgi:hypothetical protein